MVDAPNRVQHGDFILDERASSLETGVMAVRLVDDGTGQVVRKSYRITPMRGIEAVADSPLREGSVRAPFVAEPTTLIGNADFRPGRTTDITELPEPVLHRAMASGVAKLIELGSFDRWIVDTRPAFATATSHRLVTGVRLTSGDGGFGTVLLDFVDRSTSDSSATRSGVEYLAPVEFLRRFQTGEFSALELPRLPNQPDAFPLASVVQEHVRVVRHAQTAVNHGVHNPDATRWARLGTRLHGREGTDPGAILRIAFNNGFDRAVLIPRNAGKEHQAFAIGPVVENGSAARDVVYRYNFSAGDETLSGAPQLLPAGVAAEQIRHADVVGMVHRTVPLRPDIAEPLREELKEFRGRVANTRIRDSDAPHDTTSRFDDAVTWSDLKGESPHRVRTVPARLTDATRGALRTEVRESDPDAMLDLAERVLRYAGQLTDAYWMDRDGAPTDAETAFVTQYQELRRSSRADPARLGRPSLQAVNRWLAEQGFDFRSERSVLEFSRFQDFIPFSDRRHEATLFDALERHGASPDIRSMIAASALQGRAAEALRLRLRDFVLVDPVMSDHRPLWMPHRNGIAVGARDILTDTRLPNKKQSAQLPAGKHVRRGYGLPSIAEAASAVNHYGFIRDGAAQAVYGDELAPYVAALADVTVRVIHHTNHASTSDLAKNLAALLGSGEKLDPARAPLTPRVLSGWDRRLREKCKDFEIEVPVERVRRLESGKEHGVASLPPRPKAGRFGSVFD